MAPKQTQKKTREQELADRVKNLKRLQSQEASHKSQIDKLELDLLSQIQMVSDEVSDLRVLVPRMKFLSLRFLWLRLSILHSAILNRPKRVIGVQQVLGVASWFW